MHPFLIVQHGRHRRVYIEHDLVGVGGHTHETLDLTQYLGTHCPCGFHTSGAVAVGTGFTEHLVETGPHAFARHFDETELRYLQNLGACPVMPQRLFQHLEHELFMLVRVHIDKINDDQAADISQAELAHNFVHGFEIRGEHRRRRIALANKPPGVDIDGNERFGVINDDITTRFQPDFALQGAFNFFFDAKGLEQRHRLLIQDEICRQMG